MIPPPQDYKGDFFQGAMLSCVVVLIILFKLPANFDSFFLTDIRTALVGVGLVIKDEKSGLTILDKGDLQLAYSKESRMLLSAPSFFMDVTSSRKDSGFQHVTRSNLSHVVMFSGVVDSLNLGSLPLSHENGLRSEIIY